MSDVVVDTDVLSFLFKRDTRARLYRPHLLGRTLYVSFMTVAELRRWALASKWGPAKVAQLDRYLQRFAVVLVDLPLCEKWAEVMQAADKAGQPMGVADAWIAATALALSCPLVTHNAPDFQGVSALTVITAGGP
jgi:predicted nucleic acid-binding protein